MHRPLRKQRWVVAPDEDDDRCEPQRILQGGIGDQLLLIFPAAEHHRKDYVFLVPSTFQMNDFV